MALSVARAFAPGNVSCVFKIVAHDDPTRMHSLGMGFTVADGVSASVRRAASLSISFNGRIIDFPTVAAVVSAMTSECVRVELVSSLPLSSGFGLSGASALATGYALNRLLGLGLDDETVAMRAHVAEVEELTGLGDVGGQYHGGCLVKLREGHPLAAERLPVDEQEVFYRYISPIKTSEVLRDTEKRERINAAAEAALGALEEVLDEGTATLPLCLGIARQFAIDSALMRDAEVISVVSSVVEEGGAASMIMLGNAVVSNRPFPGATPTRLSRRAAGIVE